MSHPTLRFAGLNDIDDILVLAKKLYHGSPYASLTINEEKIRGLLEKIIVEGGRDYLVLLSYDGDRTVGVLVGHAYEPVFSTDKVAIEMLWYLEPEFRNGVRGRDMMDAYEYWAKGVKAKVVQYGLLSSSPEGMASLYKRRGLDRVEQIFQKVL